MKNLLSCKFYQSGIITLLFLLCFAFSAARAQESEAAANARITALTAKINAAPNDDSLYDQRGMAYFNLGKLGEVISDAYAAIGINPKNTNALFLRGQIKGIRKDYDGAITDYTIIINALPKLATRAYLKRGEMYEKKGDQERARVDYAKTLEISPKNTEAAQALARVGGAANTVISGKTVELSQNDNKQNTDIAEVSAVSSVNRLNFYVAVSLEQTSLLAEQISMFGNKDREMANSLLAKVKFLYAVLKGRTEAEELAGAVKRLQQSNNIKEFTSDLTKIHSTYRASLANEQKWYFYIGYNVAGIQFGISSKNHFLFIGKNEDFSKLVKLLPAETPASLQTSLKNLSQFANSKDLSAINSDSDYASLETQIRPIFDSVGQLKNEDGIGANDKAAEVKQISENSDRMDEMARKGDGSPYHLASHKLTYEYGKLQEQRQDVEYELMAKGNPGDPVRKKKFLADTIALYTKMRDLMQRGLQELPKFKDSRWEAVDKAQFEKNLADSNKQIEKYTAQIRALAQ